MKALLIGVAAALTLGGVAVAQDAHRSPMDADTDGDSRLSEAEFVASALARFDSNDADRDGSISTEEVQTAMQGRRDEIRERFFTALDNDRDGMISRAEFDAQAGEGAQGRRLGGIGHRGWGGHRRGDRFEADGVTRAEAETRAVAMFDRMDANDDGLLSREDRQGRRWGRRGDASE